MTNAAYKLTCHLKNVLNAELTLEKGNSEVQDQREHKPGM